MKGVAQDVDGWVKRYEMKINRPNLPIIIIVLLIDIYSISLY